MKYLLLVVIATTALTVHAAPAEIQVITTIKTHMSNVVNKHALIQDLSY